MSISNFTVKILAWTNLSVLIGLSSVSGLQAQTIDPPCPNSAYSSTEERCSWFDICQKFIADCSKSNPVWWFENKDTLVDNGEYKAIEACNSCAEKKYAKKVLTKLDSGDLKQFLESPKYATQVAEKAITDLANASLVTPPNVKELSKKSTGVVEAVQSLSKVDKNKITSEIEQKLDNKALFCGSKGVETIMVTGNIDQNDQSYAGFEQKIFLPRYPAFEGSVNDITVARLAVNECYRKYPERYNRNMGPLTAELWKKQGDLAYNKISANKDALLANAKKAQAELAKKGVFCSIGEPKLREQRKTYEKSFDIPAEAGENAFPNAQTNLSNDRLAALQKQIDEQVGPVLKDLKKLKGCQPSVEVKVAASSNGLRNLENPDPKKQLSSWDYGSTTASRAESALNQLFPISNSGKDKGKHVLKSQGETIAFDHKPEDLMALDNNIGLRGECPYKYSLPDSSGKRKLQIKEEYIPKCDGKDTTPRCAIAKNNRVEVRVIIKGNDLCVADQSGETHVSIGLENCVRPEVRCKEDDTAMIEKPSSQFMRVSGYSAMSSPYQLTKGLMLTEDGKDSGKIFYETDWKPTPNVFALKRTGTVEQIENRGPIVKIEAIPSGKFATGSTSTGAVQGAGAAAMKIHWFTVNTDAPLPDGSFSTFFGNKTSEKDVQVNSTAANGIVLYRPNKTPKYVINPQATEQQKAYYSAHFENEFGPLDELVKNANDVASGKKYEEVLSADAKMNPPVAGCP
jgi:hypothetical protein